MANALRSSIDQNPRWGVLAAFLAVTVGVGLSRFAYSAIIPVVVEAGWVSAPEAGYLGASNFVGYLMGAAAGLLGRVESKARPLLRWAMLLVGLSFLASAAPLSFAWLMLWRFIAGAAGGLLMVLAAPMALALVPPTQRSGSSGFIFSGVGFGIVASALLVPVLAVNGPAVAWVGIGALCLLAAALSWSRWPVAPAARTTSPVRTPASGAVVMTWAVYALIALGLVPHMVFLVDLVARELRYGLGIGSLCWLLFGAGAIAGPLAAGRLASFTGPSGALRWMLFVQVPAIAVPAVSAALPPLLASSLLVGASVSGSVTLTLGRIQEIVPQPHERVAAWSAATIAFAVGQAGGGYLLSLVLGLSGERFELLYLLGAAACAAAAVLTFTPAWHRPQERSGSP